ncbi:MAG TPA: biotin--[acetyl-CoA-carboxylase] ligase [Phnomibacter sp.]|nr:biotin--[acetyl-CoA-carboxylase] ligase [Phnomibacter sp.]
MNALSIGHSFEVFNTIDSTNMYAMSCIREGMAVHGAVYFAHEQYSGKGQRGKTWWSAPGENLQMTIVLQPLQLASSQHFRLVVAVALAVHDFLEHHSFHGWFIKWPNDLYWGDRKAGGILIENVIQEGKWRWAIAGIGVNINSTLFDKSLPNPTSLAQVTGLRYNTEDMARNLCSFVEKRWQQLNRSSEWPSMLRAYNKVLYGAGYPQKLRKENITTAYKIVRVNEHGDLIAGENQEYQFKHGEVEWVLPWA